MTDRRHWGIRLGRWRLSRWCEGAPCRLVGGRHPISIWRVRPSVPPTEQPSTEMDHIEAGPPHPVAARDGRGGCPVQDWLDGTYKIRCGFGITECHKHGPFETRPWPT
jgi:hypothetical protein